MHFKTFQGVKNTLKIADQHYINFHCVFFVPRLLNIIPVIGSLYKSTAPITGSRLSFDVIDRLSNEAGQIFPNKFLKNNL